MSSRSLFDWADEQAIPETRVIEFQTRRERLRRWQWLEETKPFRHVNLVIDRQDGCAPPVKLYRFPSLHPASPGSYSPGARARG